MKLTQQQLKDFDEQGYIVMQNCFSDEEMSVLRAEAEEIYKSNREEVWREKSGAPRTAFAAHTYNEAFGILGRHPRLIEPLEQFFGEPVYMHQFKINAKAPFDGAVWQWHQDYGTWARDDGMPEPRAMNISVFLDEVMPINGPLMFIPKSHKAGVCPPATTWRRHPTRCGRSITPPSRGWLRKAGSSRRPASPAAC
jgi:ectoine hydroxylase